MTRLSLPIILPLLFLFHPLQAEVVETSDHGFTVSGSQVVPRSIDEAYSALPRISRWWHPSHTYSGKSENLSLDLRIGGCFCEDYGESAARHAIVVNFQKNRLLRLRGSLGPLQELAVTGVLTLSLTEVEEGTRIGATYRVGGYLEQGLSSWAPAVDGVIMQQLDRLARYVETGSPE